MNPSFSDAELLAFLEEQLSAERSSILENILRDDEAMRARLVEVRGRHQAGLHTIGEIWRQERLSCPDREQLRQFMEGELSASRANYLRFHLKEIGCRVCQANLDDLTTARIEGPANRSRRRKFFQTSAGHLSKPDESPDHAL